MDYDEYYNQIPCDKGQIIRKPYKECKRYQGNEYAYAVSKEVSIELTDFI